MGYIPEGYELFENNKGVNNSVYIYLNNDSSLVFEQSTKDCFNSNTDNERSHLKTEVIDGQEYLINYFDDGAIDLFWDNGEYIFELSAYLPKDVMIDLCKSLKNKEK